MQGLQDFADRIAGSPSADAVGQALSAEIARFGYSTSVCTVIQPRQRSAHGVRRTFRDFTPAWAAIVEGTDYASKSMWLPMARRRATPITWLQSMKLFPPPTGAKEVITAAFDLGYRDGIVVPIHGPAGGLSITSMGTTERGLDTSPAALQHLGIATYLADQRWHMLNAGADEPPDPASRLTPRELECLQWVAAGKTDFEIGVILSVSETTVKFHIRNARDKLNATTRAQAIAEIALTGLIY